MLNPWPNRGVFIILRRMHCISATKPLNNTNPPGLRSSISPSTPLTHLIKVGLAYKARGTGRLHLELFSCHWTHPPPLMFQYSCETDKNLQSRRIILDGPISLAGWTALCRRAPRRWFAYTVCVSGWGGDVEAPTASPSFASERCRDWCWKWQHDGKNTETIETAGPRDFPWFTFQNSAIVYFPFPTVIFRRFFLTRRV